MLENAYEKAYEKGVELEKLITRLFEAKGYYAKHNALLVGRSGVKHQIDVYAEYKAPLHTSRIIVECKAYDKPVNKDIVMKLISEVNDLGVDRGILVTTSYFTPDAVSTASGYNIDLWDQAKLRELLGEIPLEEAKAPQNAFYVEPRIGAGQCRLVVERKLKGFLGMKGAIEECAVIFYPFYEAHIEGKIYVSRGVLRRTTKELIVNSAILVDAMDGSLCNYTGKRVERVLRISRLTEDEAKALKLFLVRPQITTSGLAAFLGCSTSKARRIVQGLVIKGLVAQGGRGIYVLKQRIPDPAALRTLAPQLPLKPLQSSKEAILTPKLNLSGLENMVKVFWEGVVKDYRLIYYPYYACKIAEKGRRRIEAIDMMSGESDEEASRILTSIHEQLPI